MARVSAGLLVHRRRGGAPEVLLVHPGGPFWARRDDGAWSIPKGELDDPDDDPLTVARRELSEELGVPPPTGGEIDLGEIRQRGGKRVRAFAVAGDLDASAIRSNTVEVEWPPRSGRRLEVPEVDRAGWFGIDDARRKVNPAQAELLDRLLDHLDR